MIRVTLWQNDKAEWVGFDMVGHADYGQGEYDLLCAGVSGIATALANTLTDATDFGSQVQVRLEEGEASLRVVPPLSKTQNTVLQTILKGFALNMEALQQQYEKHIDIKYRRTT